MTIVKPSKVSEYGEREIAFLKGEPPVAAKTPAPSRRHGYMCECSSCSNCEPLEASVWTLVFLVALVLVVGGNLLFQLARWWNG